MLVTLLGIVTEVRLHQSEKALIPMLVTLLGISMEVGLVHSEKAQFPMLVTPSPITTDRMAERSEDQGADK